MKTVVVCFKITYDYDELSVNDWSGGDASGRPRTDFARRILGCFDEAALENGLLLKELLAETGEEINLTALTVNPGYSEHIIKRIAAVGYDRIITVSTEQDIDFCPESTARMIAEATGEAADGTIILTGAQCAPGNTGLVPYLLAEELKAGIVCDVTRFFMHKGKIMAEAETDTGYLAEPVREGNVYILNNTEKSFLRIPTLREKMKFKDFEPVRMSTNQKACDPGVSFRPAVTARQCVFPDEKALQKLLGSIRNGENMT